MRDGCRGAIATQQQQQQRRRWRWKHTAKNHRPTDMLLVENSSSKELRTRSSQSFSHYWRITCADARAIFLFIVAVFSVYRECECVRVLWIRTTYITVCGQFALVQMDFSYILFYVLINIVANVVVQHKIKWYTRQQQRQRRPAHMKATECIERNEAKRAKRIG